MLDEYRDEMEYDEDDDDWVVEGNMSQDILRILGKLSGDEVSE